MSVDPGSRGWNEHKHRFDAGSVLNASLATDVARANQLVNGGFEVWQRGNGPFTVGGAYTADRWATFPGAGSTLSVSKDTTNMDVPSQACAALTYTHAAESFFFQQIGGGVESIVWQVRGRTLSASVRVRCTIANAVRLRLHDNISAPTYGAFHSGSGLYETLTVSKTFANNSTGLQLALSLNASGTFYVDNAMLVLGAVAADYAPLPDADDLARCLRYYERLADDGDSTLLIWGNAAGVGGPIRGVFLFKAPKAVAPTITRVGTWVLSNISGQPVSGAVGTKGLFLNSASIAAGDAYAYNNAAGNNLVVEANP